MNSTAVRNYDYQCEQVANAIKQYQQLRSSIEYVANSVDKVGKTGFRAAKEEVLCIIVDIDAAIKSLTPRQQKVIILLQQGYEYDEISQVLGIKATTAASHVSQAITRLTDYLNRPSKSIS